MAGPSRTRPCGVAAITSFSFSSAATMRCTVDRARFTRCAIWPRLSPVFSSSSARRMLAARAITCTWLLACVFAPVIGAPGVLRPATVSPCIVGQLNPKSDTREHGERGLTRGGPIRPGSLHCYRYRLAEDTAGELLRLHRLGEEEALDHVEAD